MYRQLIPLLLACAVLGGGTAESLDKSSKPSPSSAASLYLGTAVADAARDLETRLGFPLAALEIAVEPGTLTFRIENPRLPGHIEQYRYDGKAWSGPVVVTIEEAPDLAANLFPLRDVNLASISGLVETAGKEVEIFDGEVSRVSIRRQLPYSRDVRIGLAVRGTERNAVLLSDAQGQVLEARAL